MTGSELTAALSQLGFNVQLHPAGPVIAPSINAAIWGHLPGVGERAKALDFFEQALETDRSALAHVIAEYYARELDGDARFEGIKRKLGIL